MAIATQDEKNCKNQFRSEEMHREEVQKLPKYNLLSFTETKLFAISKRSKLLVLSYEYAGVLCD